MIVKILEWLQKKLAEELIFAVFSLVLAGILAVIVDQVFVITIDDFHYFMEEQGVLLIYYWILLVVMMLALIYLIRFIETAILLVIKNNK